MFEEDLLGLLKSEMRKITNIQGPCKKNAKVKILDPMPRLEHILWSPRAWKINNNQIFGHKNLPEAIWHT